MRERLQSRGHAYQQCGDGQPCTESVHFAQVVLKNQLGTPGERALQGAGVHIGVAVAVSADPRAYAHKGGHTIKLGTLRLRWARQARQARFQLGVELGQFRQKGVAEIGVPVFDFVGHGELGFAQHARLPQCHDVGAHLRVKIGLFRRGERNAVAPIEQACDFEFEVENAFALNLGRVSGQHWHDQRIFEQRLDRARGHFGGF